MLAIFDWDGVFVNSFHHLFGLCCLAQQQVSSGRPFVENDLQCIHSLTLVDLAHRIGMDETRIEQFFDTFFELQKTNPSQCPFFPGILDAAKQINQTASLAIVSSNSKWEIDRYLAGTEIENLFQAIAVGTDKRPKEEKIHQIRKDLAMPISQTYMIGDCRSDISSGKKAGIKTVGVTWGYQPKEMLQLEQPDFLVDTPAQLISLFTAS